MNNPQFADGLNGKTRNSKTYVRIPTARFFSECFWDDDPSLKGVAASKHQPTFRWQRPVPGDVSCHGPRLWQLARGPARSRNMVSQNPPFLHFSLRQLLRGSESVALWVKTLLLGWYPKIDGYWIILPPDMVRIGFDPSPGGKSSNGRGGSWQARKVNIGIQSLQWLYNHPN
jgi:hypothetical protein